MRALAASLTSSLLLCAPACGDAARPAASGTVEPATVEPEPSIRSGPLIVFLGDSLSAGLHVDAADAFPALLQRRLADEGTPFRLVNAGVSGDTTAGGVSRVDWMLAQEPDLVVVELGANDGLRGVSLEAIESNLDAIVEAVLAAGARVLLLGMKLPPNYGAPYTTEFEAVYARVAERHDVDLVPFFLEGVGGVPELNFPDGIHPTEEGHRHVAEFLEPVFRRLIREL